MALKKWEDDNLIILEHKTIDNMERQQNELPEFMSYKDKFTQKRVYRKNIEDCKARVVQSWCMLP